MKEFTYTIQDPLGIHARPAGLLVKAAQPYQSDITIVKEGKKGNVKSMLSIMGLGTKQGDEIVVQADGPDEAEAIEEISTFLKENL